MTKPSREEVRKEIARKMEYHPGDAPWSCTKCYHNEPCVEKEILLLASKALESSF